MELMNPLFEKALNLESPWTVSGIEFDGKEGMLSISIDFPRGSSFPCPKRGQPSKVYDSSEKKWRHLSFFQYTCYLVVRVPRISCPDDGILQIDVPWARAGADFTFLFESFAMTLVRETPVNRVSQIIQVDDNKLRSVYPLEMRKNLKMYKP